MWHLKKPVHVTLTSAKASSAFQKTCYLCHQSLCIILPNVRSSHAVEQFRSSVLKHLSFKIPVLFHTQGDSLQTISKDENRSVQEKRQSWDEIFLGEKGSKISSLFLFINGVITTGCSGFGPQSASNLFAIIDETSFLLSVINLFVSVPICSNFFKTLNNKRSDKLWCVDVLTLSIVHQSTDHVGFPLP